MGGSERSLPAGTHSLPRLLQMRELGLGNTRGLRTCVASVREISCARELSSWVEMDALRRCSASYSPLRPPPRSTIAAAFSPDGTLLASTHGDHTVKLISCRTGNCLRVLTGHRRTPWVVRFHPLSSQILASGSLDNEVRLWKASTAECIQTHDFGRPIASLAFHAEGEVLAVASGHKLYLWEYLAPAGTLEAVPGICLRTRRSLRAVHFHPLGMPLLLTAEVNDQDSQQEPPSLATTRPSVQAPLSLQGEWDPRLWEAAPHPQGGGPAAPVPAGAYMGGELTYLAAHHEGSRYAAHRARAQAANVAAAAAAEAAASAQAAAASAAAAAAAAAATATATTTTTTASAQQETPMEQDEGAAEASVAGGGGGGAAAGGADRMEVDEEVRENGTAAVNRSSAGASSSGAGPAAAGTGPLPPTIMPMPGLELPADLIRGMQEQTAAAAAAGANAPNAAAFLSQETPCTVKLRLWPFDRSRPKEPLEVPRLTIPHAVLCSEMGAHFSPCGRFLAACVACLPKDHNPAANPTHGTEDGAEKRTPLVYELRVYSLEDGPDGRRFGEVLAARAVRAAHCLTSIQFSPTSEQLLLAYGRRHISLLRSLVPDGTSLIPVHTILEVYRVSDMELIRVLPSAEDEVNVACFHPLPGGGLAYGTKEGRLRILRHDRSPPKPPATAVSSSGRCLEDELFEAEARTDSSSDSEG